MVIRESFDLRPQHDQPPFAPIEVPRESNTGTPDTGRVWVNGREDVEQVLNIHILRRDPSRLIEARLARVNDN